MSEREIVFPKIYLLTKRPESDCEFFEVDESKEGFYLARCKVLDRYLTVSEVKKCERFWKTCPYRRFGSQFLKRG